MTFETPGGGGIHAPAERVAAALERDIRLGLVSGAAGNPPGVA